MTMDGIIVLDKPVGITSAKALYRVRKIVGQRKSGHAGTLDPGASGVLVLCLGKATKLVERIMDQPKVYMATARLDVTSESFDADRPLEPVPITQIPSAQDVRSAFGDFVGEIQQVPPGISAIKIGGVPAYKRSRRGETLEIKARPARVYWIVVHAFEWPEVQFEMACGRGTYVRSVIRDVGEKLGTGGCLTSLVRTCVGPFRLGEAHSFDELERLDDPASGLIPLERAVEMLAAPAEISDPASQAEKARQLQQNATTGTGTVDEVE